MKEYLFHNGRLTQLLVSEDEKTGEKRLVKMPVAGFSAESASFLLQNEYEILKNIEVDGVRKVFTLDGNTDTKKLVLEYVDGITLGRYFHEGRHSLADFLKIAIQIVDILVHVHQKKIIHKNINPENIIIRQQDVKPILIDFGISAKLDLKLEHLGNPDQLQGSLYYISPEQTGRMDRLIDSRSDLYSLGVVFYELLSGQLPFIGDSPLELVHAHLAQVPVKLSDLQLLLGNHQGKIPEMLSKVVMTLLEKDPQDRYKSASGLKYDLQQCLELLVESGHIGEFLLKSHDFSDRFVLPERLYGMEAEISNLKQLFNSTAGGANHLVMVKGSAGVGKSALVRALYSELSGNNGMFVSGKFDQLNKNTPHFAFISAFTRLIELIQGENEVLMELWRMRILHAMGGLGKVLTNVIPNLEQFIGVQEDVPDLSTIEAQNRLEYLLREFVKCFAHAEHALVIFIDDLQWADESSLSLLKQLAVDHSIHGLLIIGAYRDNEVNPTHPLYMTLGEINAERQITEIEVNNLELNSVNLLVSDALSRSVADTADLASLIREKTGGNAFFIFQFLKSIYESGGVSYHYENNQWEWNKEKILSIVSTDNVIELLTQSLNKLPDDTLEALKTAACIGNTFELNMLSVLLGEDRLSCFLRIETAVVEGLITPAQNRQWNYALVADERTGKLEFSFIHDRIQQAVYGLISIAERKALNLSIARYIIANTSEEELHMAIFDVVNHMNQGVDLISHPDERTKLAGLNLSAGVRARQSAAYGQALEYFEVAIEIMGENAWRSNYAWSLSLFSGAAECAYLTGNPEKMEAFVAVVLSEAKSILDKIPVYNTLVDAYTAAHNLPKAIQAGLEALAQLGVQFPANPGMAHVFMGLGKIKLKLIGKKVESLIDLPEMTDPKMLQAMPLMERISPAAFMSGSQLFPLLVFKMVDVSLQYGNSSLSAFGYASYAITLSGVLGDYDGGYRFADMSKRLLEKYHDEVYKVKVYFVNYCFIRHWKQHASTMIEPLMEAYRSGLMAGNLFSGNWVACYALTWRYFTGQPLVQLEADLSSFSGSFRQLKQYGAYNLADILQQTVGRLTDSENVNPLLGSDLNSEEALLKRCFDANDKTAVFFLHLHRMQLNYIFGDYQKARQCARDAEPYLEAVLGLHYIPLFHFYRSLAILADANSAPGDFKLVKESIGKMKVWSKHAPDNYLHKLELMQAEWACRNGESDLARRFFDQSITHAKESGYIQEEAIALERAGQFYHDLGVLHLSRSMNAEMIKAYRQWGALAKLRQLGIQNIVGEAEQRTIDGSTTYSGENFNRGVLDMESILKATAILAGEMDSDKLIVGFMKIIMENSGANRGALMLSTDGSWFVSANVSVRSDEISRVNIPLGQDSADSEYAIPQTLVRFALNNRKSVTINDATREHDFKRDAYFKAKDIKAITCFPILNQSKLIGLVYLENNLLTEVFSEKRKEVLDIIGSQFAVTLDNIHLYNHTRQLNRAYERFVPKQFLAFLNKNSIIDVHLGDHVQREMTILFLDIRGFTGISEKMSPSENFFFLNEFLSVMEPVVRSHGGFIDKYIGDAIMALFPGSVDDAVFSGLGMLNELEKFNKSRVMNHLEPIRIGIGMHTGTIMLGTIGGNERMDTTVIADAVNIASRVEGLNKTYGTSFLVTEAIIQKMESPGDIEKLKIGEVPVYGKEQKITIYEVKSGSN